MCGIIGILAKDNVAGTIADALARLEYRGYDSAGIATIHAGAIHRRRAQGKLENLRKRLDEEPLEGTAGIGHTRWATHGMPSEKNAHPHATQRVAVVHNGIIENYQSLREELTQAGRSFTSETDTEVIPQLICHLMDQGKSPADAVQACLGRLEGAFALAIIFRDHPELLIAARRGSPLAIGYGEGEMYVGSDAIALAPLSNQICYLAEGDMAIIHRDSVEILDEEGKPAKREIKTTALSGAAIGKGDYRHFMQKEIFEQPAVIGDTLNVYYNPAEGEIHLPDLPIDLANIDHVTLVACGTSYYAGLVARYWLEQISGVRVDVDVASEFRYRQPRMPENGISLFISQSGETADTLAALKYVKEQGQKVIALVNVAESSMALEADGVLQTYAGPEIGVASTKAFTTQLTALGCFAIALGHARGALTTDAMKGHCRALAEVPSKITEVLHHDDALRTLAQQISHANHMLYIGRGTSFAIAHEAALKMKEISYIHAEAYAAGEMKHGPIALIDQEMPVIAIAPSDALFDKTLSNIQEAAARGAQIIAFTDAQGAKKLKGIAAQMIELPAVDPLASPILYAIPSQLLAYHTAVIKGTDVDQPRNLAKSVTVE